MMNDLCFIVSDLHGRLNRYQALFREIRKRKPSLLLMAGDFLPGGFNTSFQQDFYDDFLLPELQKLQKQLKAEYPDIALIMGNDDPRADEKRIIEIEKMGYWKYIHNTSFDHHGYEVIGYAFVPPTPFMLKDWEKYDVSRYVDPGCVHPTEGFRSVEIPKDEIEFSTIADDLKILVEGIDPKKSIFVFHSPPYKSLLDIADLEGKYIDHVPLDIHVGSIAIQRFIQKHQPYLTIHGHVHESTRLSGSWKDHIGKTLMVNASTNENKLSLITVELNDLQTIKRELL